MIQTVLNLQEAYAKALLVDRSALERAQDAGDILAANRLLVDAFSTDVRPLCAKVRTDLGAAADPIAAFRATDTPTASPTSAGTGRPPHGSDHRQQRTWCFMALTAPPMYENRWAPPPSLSELDALVYRSNLLASDRSIVNFGGGNTSVKTREIDHAGRETTVLWVKGSGTDLATITARRVHRAAARRDPAAGRARRDDRRGDGRLPRALPDRPVDAAAVDRDAPARVRTASPRRPHPSGCDRSDRRYRRRRAACSRSASAPTRFGSRTSAPALRFRSSSLRRSRCTLSATVVLLAKHGLVTWGETAEESYAATLDAINRAADVHRRAYA